MAKYNDTTLYQDQEIEFTYEGNEYRWVGDYEVREWGETSSYDYPGDSDQEVKVVHTSDLCSYDPELDQWLTVYPSGSILATIENEIESTL